MALREKTVAVPAAPGREQASAPRPANRWLVLSGRVLAVALPPLIAFGIAMVLWQRTAASDPYLLPRLGKVVDRLTSDPGFFVRNGRTTLWEAMAGLTVGAGIAIVLAVVMSQVRVVQRALLPLAVVLNVTPVVTIAPALVVAFGFGSKPKIIVTAIITFFPMLITMLAGLRSVEPQALEVFRTLHASRLEVLFRLQLPSSLPFLFAGARVCLPLSVIGAVVAEFVAAGTSSGLGNVITIAARESKLDLVYASIFCLAFMGVVLTAVVTLLERWLLSWHVSQRGQH